MLPLLKSDRRPQKCQITSSTLPAFIDPLQPPQKSAPFNALWALKWCHTIDILLPAELRDVIKQTETRQLELARLMKQNNRYAKVIMKLGQVLEGDFFNEYVKKGWSCAVNLCARLQVMLTNNRECFDVVGRKSWCRYGI